MFIRKRPASFMLGDQEWERQERSRLNAQARRRDGRPPTPVEDGRTDPRALWVPTPNQSPSAPPPLDPRASQGPSPAPSTEAETPSQGSPVYDMNQDWGGQAQSHNQSPNYSDLDYDDDPRNYDSDGYLLPGGTVHESQLSSVPEAGEEDDDAGLGGAAQIGDDEDGY